MNTLKDFIHEWSPAVERCVSIGRLIGDGGLLNKWITADPCTALRAMVVNPTERI